MQTTLRTMMLLMASAMAAPMAQALIESRPIKHPSHYPSTRYTGGSKRQPQIKSDADLDKMSKAEAKRERKAAKLRAAINRNGSDS